jgi:hypothetical protein
MVLTCFLSDYIISSGVTRKRVGGQPPDVIVGSPFSRHLGLRTHCLEESASNSNAPVNSMDQSHLTTLILIASSRQKLFFNRSKRLLSMKLGLVCDITFSTSDSYTDGGLDSIHQDRKSAVTVVLSIRQILGQVGMFRHVESL